MCQHVLCQSCECCYCVCIYVYNPHVCVCLSLSFSLSPPPPPLFVCPLPPGAQHPSGHGLRRGPPPLRSLPGSFAAVQGLETCVEYPGHQHWRVPPPQTGPLPQGLHPQQHHGEETPQLITCPWKASGVHQRRHMQMFPTACTSINAFWSPDMSAHAWELISTSTSYCWVFIVCISLFNRSILKRGLPLVTIQKVFFLLFYFFIFWRPGSSNYLVFPQLAVAGIPRSK